MRAVLRNRRILIAGGFLILVVVLSVGWRLFTPYGYQDQVAVPLSGDGLLGGDDFGRDVFTRLLVGIRTSLLVAAGSVLLAAVAGVTLGMVAGYTRRAATVIMRAVDVLLSFPAIILAIAVVAVLGPSVRNVLLVIGVIYIPRFARIAYGQTLTVTRSDYVAAAQAMGSGPVRTLTRVVLPNIGGPLLVQAALSLSFAIQTETGLSFLGLGAQPPLSSLGTMVAAGRDFLEVRPSLLVVPALVVVAIVLAIHVLTDGLRDALDPRQGSPS